MRIIRLFRFTGATFLFLFLFLVILIISDVFYKIRLTLHGGVKVFVDHLFLSFFRQDQRLVGSFFFLAHLFLDNGFRFSSYAFSFDNVLSVVVIILEIIFTIIRDLLLVLLFFIDKTVHFSFKFF